MLARLIGEDVQVSIRLHPDGLGVKADPGQIEQVVLNLAINSRDAMPQGGKLSDDRPRTRDLDGPVAEAAGLACRVLLCGFA